MDRKFSVEFIQVPNLLLAKVTLNSTGVVDLTVADRAIDALAVVFVQRLPKEFRRIEAAFSALQATPDVDVRHSVLFRLLHDLKGQAGTFDYNLISVIGNDTCRFLERRVSMTPGRLKVVRFHIDAMKRVAEEKMTGDQHQQGLQMINDLHTMTHEVLQEEQASAID